eukprot:CAMPEP_0197055072 /NCGR_PEP_ID=MMETSP1384-20130603/56826_1 /TAXON_ID=29189 /ORGANISM="Ammonia sp." /LENGTH=202 /DNA_ID=CAMNT_0042488503 /DNA_START=21 /DNA_END=629 /DNA_ORIENTATION=+
MGSACSFCEGDRRKMQQELPSKPSRRGKQGTIESSSAEPSMTYSYSQSVDTDVESQLAIFNNATYKERTMALLSEHDGAFQRFARKYSAKLFSDAVWKKLDTKNKGYIERSRHFANVFAFAVMLYKTKQHQKMTNSKDKVKLDKPELLKDVKHISVWIVRKYGEPDPNSMDDEYVFKVTKTQFGERFSDWIQAYLQHNGELY